MKKYRVDETELHKKNLGKNTLKDKLVSVCDVTMGLATSVYHYTSPEGVMGILKNREIYFTDAQYLNDYRERMSINDELRWFWTQHYREYDKQFMQLFKGIYIDSYEDNGYAYLDEEMEEGVYRYFILSASMNKDSLSMWKYYAKNGTYNGYNINLFIPALDDEWIDRDTGVAVESGLVIYDSNHKQEIIRKFIEKLYTVWCTYNVADALNQKLVRDYRAWASYASLFFKNDCFKTEEEMRFVAIVPKCKLNDLAYRQEDGTIRKMYDFRIVNNVITPYIKMPLFGWNIEENWITSRIGVGPCMDFELRKEGIMRFVESLDYSFHQFDVVQSDIPVRY